MRATLALETDLAGAWLPAGGAHLSAPHRNGKKGRRMSEARSADPDIAALNACLQKIASSADRGAFMQLFDHFGPRLKYFLLQKGCTDGEAEDLVQDVMLTVWRKAKQFDPGKAAASTWIFTIARNRFIDTKRRERVMVDFDTCPEAEQVSEETAEDEITQSELAADVAAAMAELPQAQAEVIQMAFIDGKSHSEIAEELGVPLGTVKSRIRLAFARLREVLESHR
jgi:RNA polymerase sigma-70 factor (ECF subfamily)